MRCVMFEEELVELEKLYRYKTSIRTPHFDGIECYRIDGVYQRQFFVLDKCESKTDTIVVLIGVNYTQHQAAESSIYP